MPAIELTAPRIIVIEDRGKQYKFTLARITKQQWLKYFDGVISTSENQGGKRIDSFDSSAARLELVQSALTGAEGYKTEQPIESLENWQELLPLSHRLGIANSLINVGPAAKQSDEEEIVLGAESVLLDAVWGADETGVMRKYHGLRHTFKTPTAEHQRRYSRDSSRSCIVGGSRTAKTRWLGAQGTLIALYDELVTGVEGYAVDGKENLDRDAIVQYMDSYHKVAAADQLFSPAAPKLSEEDQ